MTRVLSFLGSCFSIFSTILLFPFLYKREEIKLESAKNKLLGEKLVNLRLIHEMKEADIFTKIEAKKLKKKCLN